MAFARERAEWDRASAIVASIENVLKGRDDPLTQPLDRNPYRFKEQAEPPKQRIGSLKGPMMKLGGRRSKSVRKQRGA